MKKNLVVLLLFVLLLCGCGRQTGNVSELTRYDWQAVTEGGGEATLSFRDGRAALCLQNGGETETIEGSFLADETSLVIFDAAAAQNYGFRYVPRGEKLDLSFEGNTLEMTALPR